MAVTQQSDGNSTKPVNEGAESSSREGTDAGPCGLIQLRKSDGSSTGPGDIKKDACGMVKGYKSRQNQNKGYKSERLSDAEVSGYLNTKEEIHLKSILWEAMNGKFTKAKKQKRTTETKKDVSPRKSAKTTKKSEVKRRSSKINYDALKMLNDELDQNLERAEIIGDISDHRTENSTHGNISDKKQGSSKSSYEDDVSYYEDGETGEGEMLNGYGDEHFSDEYFDF